MTANDTSNGGKTMKAISRNEDGDRVVTRGGVEALYVGGGSWHVTNGGTLVEAYATTGSARAHLGAVTEGA